MVMLKLIGLLLVCTCRLSLQTSKTPELAPETESTPIDSATTDYATSTVESCDSDFGNCTNLTATEPPLETTKNGTTRQLNATMHQSSRKWSEPDWCTCDLLVGNFFIQEIGALLTSAAFRKVFATSIAAVTWTAQWLIKNCLIIASWTTTGFLMTDCASILSTLMLITPRFNGKSTKMGHFAL